MKLLRRNALRFGGWIAACGLLGMPTISRCVAQALPTAKKSMDISVFGGYENANPVYGEPARNDGEGFGFNITRYFMKLPVAPSLEGRVNLTNGAYVKERTYLMGLQVQGNLFQYLHPYADFLSGTGTIHFNIHPTGYLGDNSIVESYGGGMDIDLVHHFQAKVDFQYQSWTLGHNVSFAPTILLIGVNYRIPFRDYKQTE